MKKITLIVLLAFGFLLCNKKNEDINEVTESGYCQSLAENLIAWNRPEIKVIFDSLFQQYPPLIPTTDDIQGHLQNSYDVMDKINTACSQIRITLECYACAESNPPQSTFRLEVDSAGVQIARRIAVYVPDDDFMYMN